VPDHLLETATSAEPAAPPGGRRRYGAGAVFGAVLLGLLLLLLVRDPGVFTHPVLERGDDAANSLLVEQAKHLQLLVGNYSRVGFSHPGPAVFYLEALGQWLGHDVLHALPAPYNGEWLAIMVLNAALAAAALTVLWSWSRSWRALLWYAALLVGFVALHPHVFSSTWMPDVYVAPFLLFLVSAASVVAGRTGHLWLFVLAGSLLVHGHVVFLLLFVPGVTLATLAGWWLVRRRTGQRVVRRHWAAGLAVAGLFAVPMVVNLVLHWPGEFGKYLHYGNAYASAHGLRADLDYLVLFWSIGPVPGWVVAPPLLAGAVLVTRRACGARAHLLTAGTGLAALVTVLFAGYVVRGIDVLQGYIGYFMWVAPLLLALVIVTGLVPPGPAAPTATATATAGAPGAPDAPGPVRRRLATALPATALAGAVLAALLAPGVPTVPAEQPRMAVVVRELSAYAAGRPAVVTLDHDAWPDMTALLITAERSGLRACLREGSWRFMVTGDYICRPGERAAGVPVRLRQPPGADALQISFGTTVLRLPLPTG
jgi:hypothetical protein